MDYTAIILAVLGSGIVGTALIAGHAWLKAHAAATPNKTDDAILKAFDTIDNLVAHNTALASFVAQTPNKLDDAALKLAQDVDAEINKPAA